MTKIAKVKSCSTCHIEKGLENFYKNKSRPDGFSHNCITCDCKRSKRWHKNNREKSNQMKYRHMKKFPERQKVRIQVANVVKNGTLIKTPCAVCKDENSQAHHEDYAKPLEVIWLCPTHHAQRHYE